MLINLSNHPSRYWSQLQLEAAKKYGEVIDIDFPNINANEGESYIEELAEKYLHEILVFVDKCGSENCIVHIMGEQNFSFVTVNKLMSIGIKCIASASDRKVSYEKGKKIVEFNFIRFRYYR